MADHRHPVARELLGYPTGEAKRARGTARLLAEEFSDQPGYREEWRP